MTIQEMKAFCAENNIAVEGNKRLKRTWETAIENWKALQVQAVALTRTAKKLAIIPWRSSWVGLDKLSKNERKTGKLLITKQRSVFQDFIAMVGT